MNTPADGTERWRFATLLKRYHALRLRAAESRWILPTVGILFAAGVWWSWARLDLDLRQLGFGGLAASAALAIPAAMLSAAEYYLAQRLVGSSTGAREATSVALLGSVANLLPVPGGAIVRVDAMASTGSRVSKALRITAGIGLVWVGLALASSGFAVLSVGSRPASAWILIVVGVVVAVGGMVSIGPQDRRSVGLLGAIVLVEVLVIAIATWRIHLVLGAIGEQASLIQALGLVSAGAVAVSVGLVPAGLGIRELFAGLLAPLVGLPPAAGFLTAGLNQVLSLLGQGLLALVARVRRE